MYSFIYRFKTVLSSFICRLNSFMNIYIMENMFYSHKPRENFRINYKGTKISILSVLFFLIILPYNGFMI